MSSGNTVKTGTGTSYWLLQDSEGRQLIAGAAAEDAAVEGNPVLVGGRYDATARTLEDGDVGAVAIDSVGRLINNPGWATSLVENDTPNDSDKSFVIPALTESQIQTIWVDYTSDGNAGNRQLCVELQSPGTDVVLQIRAGAVQAASLTRYYFFASGVVDMTAFRDTDYISNVFPSDLVIPAAYIIRIYDKAAISAAGDDMVVRMLYKTRAVI